MINLLKGSRFECKRNSMDAASIEELYGPPVAVPFKWEESPGKAKPVEKDTVLQIGGSDEFYNMLMRKEGSTGRRSFGSLYRTAAHGNVPFLWEDEPGKPKMLARDEYATLAVAPLTPPPFLQWPGYTNSLCTVQRPSKTTPKWFHKKLMKSIFEGMFLGVTKPGCLDNNNGNWKPRSHESANSARLGSSESIGHNGSSSFKTCSVDDTSEFSYDEACRISNPTPRCFARCPTLVLPRILGSRNFVRDQKRSPLDLKNAYFSMITRMRLLTPKNSSVATVITDNEEYLHQQEQEGGLDFEGDAKLKILQSGLVLRLLEYYKNLLAL